MAPVPGGKDGAAEPDGDLQQGKPTPAGTPPPANWRRYARVTVWVVVAAAVLVFLFTNSDEVPVNFLLFRTTAPLWLILAVVFAIGILLGWTASWWWRRRARKRRRDRD